MVRKLLILGIAWMSGVGILFVLLSIASAQGSRVFTPAGPEPSDTQMITPTIQSISPSEVKNGLQSEITIHGENFEIVLSGTEVLTAPQVLLDEILLNVVSGIPTTVLTAVVPCGLDIKEYSLTITNPSGGIATLEKAVSVTQSPKIWTTGGPYGGAIQQIVLVSNAITTVYAVSPEAGLFVSYNAAEHWQLLFPAYMGWGPIHAKQSFTLKPDQLDFLYVGNYQGLYRSTDGGKTFPWPKILSGHVTAVAYSPQAPYLLYVGIAGGIQTTTDAGDTWGGPGEGLPTMDYPSIAVHPLTSTIAYAGSADGHIFKTIDGGDTWSEFDTPDFPHEFVNVYLDPYNSDNIYATSGYFGTIFQRYVADEGEWHEMIIPDGKPTNNIVFHPQNEGIVYGMNCWGIYKSIDYGESWTHPMGNMPDCMSSVVLHPDTGEPFMAGGSFLGFWKCDSEQDCDWYMGAWAPSSDGILALIPGRIAVADYAPWNAYTSASDAGGFYTSNGGQQWMQAQVTPTLMLGNPMRTVAVDPHDPCVAFLGSDYAPIYRTLDCGKSWSTHALETKPDLLQQVHAIAIDPHDTNSVFAGGMRFPIENDYHLGMVFTTTDRGETWSEIDFGHPISQVSSIAFDPQVTGTVYIATGGRVGWLFGTGSLYKSIDGGKQWQEYQAGLPGEPISILAIDPADPNTLYVGLCADPEPNVPLYRTTNGGVSWQPLGTGLEGLCISDIYINPLGPDEMYISALGPDILGRQGLYYSNDHGIKWTHIETDTIRGNVYCLDGGVCDSGTKPLTIFVCTLSLPPPNSTLGSIHNVSIEDMSLYGAGVFQKTFSSMAPRLYLPLILQSR